MSTLDLDPKFYIWVLLQVLQSPTLVILLVLRVIILILYLLGIVYAVEFSHRSGRDLVNLAKKRTNIVPLIMDARKPLEYRSLVYYTQY